MCGDWSHGGGGPVLHMDNNMAHLLRALCHREWAQHADRLPQQGDQKQQGAQAARHGRHCISNWYRISVTT